MKTMIHALLLGGLLCLGIVAPAAAQSGFALKGHYLYNSSAAGGIRSQPSASNGVGIGVELVLPLGVGVGVSAYRARGGVEPGEEAGTTVFLAEANYFLRLPLGLSPYVGVHAGLDTRLRRDPEDPGRGFFKDSRSQLGYQAGLRLQPISLIGLDLQYRRMSTSAALDQGTRLERGQVLIGVTLF